MTRVQWSIGHTLSKNLQCYALAEVAQRASIYDQAFCGPAQHVNKAGSHGQAFRIYLLSATRIRQVSNCRDRIRNKGNIRNVRSRSCTIVYGSLHV